MLKFKMGTARLGTALAKVVKGTGNKNIPVTEYLLFVLDKGSLTITATNSVNWITCKLSEVDGDDGKVIVQADKLTKLVDRTTKTDMSFAVKQDGEVQYLEVKGNGTYKIALYSGDEFPLYTFDRAIEAVSVETVALKKAFHVNKAALPTERTIPYLSGYKVGKSIVTTDGVRMCVNETVSGLFEDPGVLITSTLADLVGVITDETVKVRKSDNAILITSDEMEIFGAQLSGIEDYPAVEEVLSIEYDHACKILRTELAEALDRLSLFADQLDSYAVRLTFGLEAIRLTDKQERSTEIVAYTSSEHLGMITEPSDVVISVNVNYMKALVDSFTAAEIELMYGDELPIMISADEVTMVLGTLED